jgi:hypothetical protein
MTKSKEWLIFNAVKCWLHYCSTTTEYTEEYYKLRDEYEALLNPNDEPVEEFKDATYNHLLKQPANAPTKPNNDPSTSI